MNDPEVPRLIRRLLDSRDSAPTQRDAVIVEDRGFQVGEKLVIEARTNPISLGDVHDGPSVSLIDAEPFHGTVLALGFRQAGAEEIIGSAVMVAPGIALTAMHSILEYEDGLRAGTVFPFLIATGRYVQAWAIYQVQEVPNTDLAVLSLKPLTGAPPDGVASVQSVSTRVPAPGERVFLVGFRATAAATSVGTITNITAALIATSGEVGTHYLNGRDSHLMPWPCIEVQAPTWGGMSGGPVLDSAGRLVGVVCSSIEASDDLGPAYVSLLWPALVHPFMGAWPAQVYQTLQTLLTMPVGCSIDRRDALSPASDLATRKPVWCFEPW